MKPILEKIELSQHLLRERLVDIERSEAGLTKEVYIRFLSMQFHLTKGVQKPFLQIAANSLMSHKKELRAFLIAFAQEEENHYLIAESDLKELGAEPLDMPLDLKLWWLYFDSIIWSNPFIRLGATAILENISEKSSDVLDSLILKSTFINKKNIKFLIIHRHGPSLDHGHQIIDVLEKSNLSDTEFGDLVLGAEIATTMYLRLIHWVRFNQIQK